jgi:hypothetical protein
MAADSWHDALPFVASRLTDEPKAISVLLCTSRAAAQAIEKACTGSLELCLQLHNEAQVQRITPFLAKHAKLLKALELSCVTRDAAAAAAAAQIGTTPAAAKLTRLRLQDCELGDATLLALVRGMSALQHLDVSNNLLLTDAALTGLAGELQQLVELDAVMTSITRAARDRLQATRPGLAVKLGRPRRIPVCGCLLDPVGGRPCCFVKFLFRCCVCAAAQHSSCCMLHMCCA